MQKKTNTTTTLKKEHIAWTKEHTESNTVIKIVVGTNALFVFLSNFVFMFLLFKKYNIHHLIKRITARNQV